MVKGRRVKPVESFQPERALFAGVCLQAVRDAKAGDPEAVDWCETVLPLFLRVLKIERHDWREAGDIRKVTRQQPITQVEANRRYQERQRASRGIPANNESGG